METTAAGFNVIDADAGVLTYGYTFSGSATSTTFIARMQNGQLMVISPSTGLTEDAVAELAEFGEVGALVANNGLHHLGQREWRERFPDARCFAPAAAAARIAKKSGLTFEAMSELSTLAGPNIVLRELPNTRIGESWCSVQTDAGHVWFVSDVLANMPQLPPAFLPRMAFKLTKSGPGYTVFHLALKFGVKDKSATLQLMLDDMAAREPVAVVPSHGGILTDASVAAETRALIQAAL